MSSKSKKTSFSHEWLLMDKFKSWVAPVERDSFSAKCKLCQKMFALSNMGEQALISHMPGKKHKNAVSAFQSLSMEAFCFPKNLSKVSVNNEVISDPSLLPSGSATSATVQQSLSHVLPSTSTCSDVVHSSKLKSRGLEVMLEKDNVTKAEVL